MSEKFDDEWTGQTANMLGMYNLNISKVIARTFNDCVLRKNVFKLLELK
jgi:hypothetical protein